MPPSAVGTPTGVEPFSLVPLVIPAANIVAGWDAIQLSATPVALWPDASGNGFDLSQAVGASQPSWGAATGPNGQPAVLFDGVDDSLANAALDLPAPGTTPTYYWAIVRQVTWTSTDAFWGGNGGLILVQDNTGTPSIGVFNGGFITSPDMTLNTYFRLAIYLSDSINDSIVVGSSTVTGASAGNIDCAAGFGLAYNYAATVLFGNIQVCELWIFNVKPTAAQLAALDSYAASRYGAGVLT